jgi:hypothetical protein
MIKKIAIPKMHKNLGRFMCISTIAGILFVGTAGAFNLDNEDRETLDSTGDINTCVSTNGHLAITPGFADLNVKDTLRFNAVAFDQNRISILGQNYTWRVKTIPTSISSKGNDTNPNICPVPSIGIIDENGLFTATADGFGLIIAETEFNGQHLTEFTKVVVGNVTLPPPGWWG